MQDLWQLLSAIPHAALGTAGRIAFVIAVAFALDAGARRIVRAITERTQGADDGVRRRRNTVARSIRYLFGGAIVAVTATLVLDELGVSLAPLLTTAGVAGVVLGFGAQSLVGDYFSGIMLLIEDQIREGDVVRIADKDGVVEDVTLRYVKLRNVEGRLIFVPNGQIKIVENLTRGYAQPLIEVGVSYDQDVDASLAALREILEEAFASGGLDGRIKESPEILGVQELGSSAVLLRARVRVEPPSEQWNVRRELLRRVRKGFAERGVEIPFPQLTVHTAPSPSASQTERGA